MLASQAQSYGPNADRIEFTENGVRYTVRWKKQSGPKQVLPETSEFKTKTQWPHTKKWDQKP